MLSLDNILNWVSQVYPYLQNVLSAITWNVFNYLFTSNLAILFSLAGDALLVFVGIGLLKRLILIVG